MAVTQRLRFEILRRDSHTCRYCGASAPDVPLTVDHVIPAALGGGDDPTNLVTACKPCNSGKSSTSPDERVVADVDETALMFAQALDEVNAIRRRRIIDLHKQLYTFHQQWTDWKSHLGTAPLPPSWRGSIAKFIEEGLSTAELQHFTRIAMEGKAAHTEKFVYMCGCCWREIGTRQAEAREKFKLMVEVGF